MALKRKDYSFEAVFFATTFFAGALAAVVVLVAVFFTAGALAVPAALVEALERALP